MSAILITQCLQNDFVKAIGKYESLPNALHIGYAESQRLLGSILPKSPLLEVMDWAQNQNARDLSIIHIRDWHDENDPLQADHLKQFGKHCIRNTEGADFVFPVDHDRSFIVDASGLNDFQGTKLDEIIKGLDTKDLKIGIVGVWTEAKVYFLAYELITRFPHAEIAVCSALCAGSSRHMHFLGLEQLKKILGLRVFTSSHDFMSFLTGILPAPGVPSLELAPHIKLQLAHPLSQTEKSIINIFFRNHKEVDLKSLDGGFSGNQVLKVKSIDLLGHTQVPSVLKMGKRNLISKERESFERVEEVLGNNAPQVIAYVEMDDRAAIQYRYASMTGAPVNCFQDIYESGMDLDVLFEIVDKVFLHELGKLYSAKTFEKLNYLETYDFDPKYAQSVVNSAQKIIDNAQAIKKDLSIDSLKVFYTETIAQAKNSQFGNGYLSFVHGDLNGKNIIVDGQKNVWIIDFFSCERAPILKDLIKLENDILFIFMKVSTNSGFLEAKMLLEFLLDIEDIARPLESYDLPSFTDSEVKRAFLTICKLRSYYKDMVELDKSAVGLQIGQLRYAAHTLGFDEPNQFQKELALVYCLELSKKLIPAFGSAPRLRLDYIPEIPKGKLGLTILPGRKDRNRDLEEDLESLKNEGIDAILCLVTTQELLDYGVPDLLQKYAGKGFEYLHHPIIDQSIPEEVLLRKSLDWLGNYLGQNKKVMIHCLGGLGRSGLLAAAYLKTKCGCDSETAINIVRKARGKRAIENKVQENFIRSFHVL